MLYQGSWSRQVTCLTTGGNSRVHDVVCAKAMPSRSAFRRSLVPVFYLVLLIMANGSDATIVYLIATDIIFFLNFCLHLIWFSGRDTTWLKVALLPLCLQGEYHGWESLITTSISKPFPSIVCFNLIIKSFFLLDMIYTSFGALLFFCIKSESTGQFLMNVNKWKLFHLCYSLPFIAVFGNRSTKFSMPQNPIIKSNLLLVLMLQSGQHQVTQRHIWVHLGKRILVSSILCSLQR